MSDDGRSYIKAVEGIARRMKTDAAYREMMEKGSSDAVSSLREAGVITAGDPTTNDVTEVRVFNSSEADVLHVVIPYPDPNVTLSEEDFENFAGSGTAVSSASSLMTIPSTVSCLSTAISQDARDMADNWPRA